MRNKRISIVLTAMGALLVAAALALVAANLVDGRRAGAASSEALTKVEQEIPEAAAGEEWTLSAAGEVEIPDYILNPEAEMPVVSIDNYDYICVLNIPSLGMSLPVMSDWSYPQLRVAPCRYYGSAYTGDMVIAAHNYNAHFGTLKILAPGAEVIFTDMDGNVFNYEVALVETLQPYDVDILLEDGWDLTLFTCTLGGQSRVTVRCVEIK